MLILILLGLAISWIGACAIWPFAACKSCGGTGKSPSPTKKAWRLCGSCEGKGRRVRVGRRIYERGLGIDEKKRK